MCSNFAARAYLHCFSLLYKQGLISKLKAAGTHQQETQEKYQQKKEKKEK